MTEWEEKLLADLFDGESVDPDALEQALTQPDAAPYLVRMVRLRQLAQEDDRQPDEAFYREMTQVLHRKRAWFLRGPMLPLPVAVAAGLCGMVLVAWVSYSPTVTFIVPPGPKTILAADVPLPPPPPDAQPYTTVAGATEKAPTPATVVQVQARPPRAAREVRFVDGADWRTIADRGVPDHGPH